MTLTDYFIQSFSDASNGAVAGLWDVSSGSGSTTGNATASFPHSDGVYDINFVYRSEYDGASLFSISVASIEVASFTAIEQTTGEDKYETFTINDIQIHNGDEIRVDGTQDAAAWAKFDYIDFIYQGAIPQDPPTYTINYTNERTNQAVATYDEYSYNQSTWTDGPGTYLDLTPGQNVWFRPKSYPSAVQALTVPSRPGTPNFSINYATEVASTGTSTTYEYSTDDFASAGTTFTGNQLSVTPGTDLYIRRKATASSFASASFFLDVAARPATPDFVIDFDTEVATASSSATYEYSTDDFSSVAGTFTGTEMSVTPGTDLAFRVKSSGSSFASLVQNLDVPDRAAAPVFTIDYLEELAQTTDSAAYQYSDDDFSSVEGEFTGKEVSITPGRDYYFRQAPGDGNFGSASQMITLPDRSAAPVFTINYATEATNEVLSSSQEYMAESVGTWISGTSGLLDLPPDDTYYLRNKSTGSDFASASCTLSVPARPSFDAITVDFFTKKTSTAIANGVEYSIHSDMSDPMIAIGAKINLTPGVDLYFHTPATASSYESEIFQLDVPAEPVIEAITDISSTVTNYPIIFSITFESEVTGFELSDLTVKKALAENISGNYQFELYPYATGLVEVYLLPNRVEEGNFTSNSVSFDYDGPVVVGTEEISLNEFQLYPNPSSGLITIEFSEPGNNFVKVIDTKGNLVFEQQIENQQDLLDLQELPQGLYMIRVYNDEGASSYRRIILAE